MRGLQPCASGSASLEAFVYDYPECTALLLYRGENRLKIDEILCVPVEEFLKDLRPDQSLDAGRQG